MCAMKRIKRRALVNFDVDETPKNVADRVDFVRIWDPDFVLESRIHRKVTLYTRLCIGPVAFLGVSLVDLLGMPGSDVHFCWFVGNSL